MNDIIIFKPEEQAIVDTLVEELNRRRLTDELASISSNEMALNELSRSISMYPSILGSQSLGTSLRSVETLIENMVLHDMVDMLFHIPTKAILGQGYALAKINFFFMLLYICRETGKMKNIEADLLTAIQNNIYSIMAEEVFIAIIADKKIPMHIRSNAGYLLVNIWEHRLDHCVEEFAPTLTSIWLARDRLRPGFGTMLGVSELFSLAAQSDPVWFDFLQREELNEEEVNALQEFLLGLSYEEMKHISYHMKQEGKSAVNGEDVTKLIGEGDLDQFYREGDPRRFFKSFSHRKNNAIYRARGNLTGPKKTFEEYLMCFLLSRPGEWRAAPEK